MLAAGRSMTACSCVREELSVLTSRCTRDGIGTDWVLWMCWRKRLGGGFGLQTSNFPNTTSSSRRPHGLPSPMYLALMASVHSVRCLEGSSHMLVPWHGWNPSWRSAVYIAEVWYV